MSDTKKVQKVREKMISIYGEGCWMGYKLTKNNPYTYHHIVEKRNGGGITVDNGALLTRFAHNDLNELENHARYLYRELNSLFKELNKTRKPPTREYFKEVNGILLCADKIITLSDHCELNPDFVMLEEFSQMTQECYPDIPDEKTIRKYSYKEYEEIEIPSDYSPKIKRRNRKTYKNRCKYNYY